MIAAVAASRNPRPRAHPATWLPGSSRSAGNRRSARALLPLGEMPDELAGILIRFFDDADDDLALLAGATLATARPQRSTSPAACCPPHARRDLYHAPPRSSPQPTVTRATSPAPCWRSPNGSSTCTSRRPATSAAGAHAASVLGRIAVGIYAQEQGSPARLPGPHLIDAMVLARSYGLEEQLAKLDR